ncbi:2-phospho-L-lactate guanylyltransferase [Halieaceae bacterium IMCC14734]|uniref:3-phospho-D-glycerate guanylyltransferase n=1 Tax=Candidatus Litorirhabdus singularis TaxID=2518993 RepID=A0ABT3TKG5_9GAMM|nr:2-phospho-L-lactate guanylyltransferase [Candidatus Litorirhabdus singularis]MCX2981857.1 2-phospho-L-lactate guanylyltransferase [Candidatus Litorirhabdus singularis]
MVWAVLPLKDLVKAKSRLSGVLAPFERRVLMQAMVEDVLTALASVAELEGVLVVSDDPSAELLAHKYGLEWVAEARLGAPGLNGSVAAATAMLAERGVTDFMVLHGDIPLLCAADLQQLLAVYASSDTDIVIAPDLNRDGTNIMVLPAAAELPFCYGQASCAAHTRLAEERGLSVRLVESERTGLDVDEPEDLLRLYHHLVNDPVAEHCAGLLLVDEISQRLRAVDSSGLGTAAMEVKHDAV